MVRNRPSLTLRHSEALCTRVALIDYGDIMAVKSPCIDVCEFDSRTGYCLGCARTLEEARKWEKLTDYRRHTILNDRARRETKLGKRVGHRDEALERD